MIKKENKKIIGMCISNEELYNYAKGIAIKALKLMESKGNLYASNILTYRHCYCKDIFDDLMQEVVMVIIQDNYIITKKAFQVVNNYLYNYKNYASKFELLIDSDKDNDIEFLNRLAYLEYNSEKILINNTATEKQKNIINALDLTERQREILDIYSKTQNKTKTGEFLGISKQAVDKTIKTIQNKTKKLNIQYA